MALALGVGCGGGDAVTTDATALVPSRADYIAEADSVCSRAEDRIEAEAEARFGLDPGDLRTTGSGRSVFRPGRRPSAAEIDSFALQTAIPALRDQVEELRALTPPAGDAQRVAAVYDAAERGTERLAAAPEVLADQARARALFAEANRLARGYGLRTCGL